MGLAGLGCIFRLGDGVLHPFEQVHVRDKVNVIVSCHGLLDPKFENIAIESAVDSAILAQPRFMQIDSIWCAVSVIVTLEHLLNIRCEGSIIHDIVQQPVVLVVPTIHGDFPHIRIRLIEARSGKAASDASCKPILQREWPGVIRTVTGFKIVVLGDSGIVLDSQLLQVD